MKALLIIACVLLLLILPLLLNLKLFIRYENEKFCLSAGILFFRYQLGPQKEKKKQSQKKHVHTPPKSSTVERLKEISSQGKTLSPKQKECPAKQQSEAGQPSQKAQAAETESPSAVSHSEKRDFMETVSMACDIIRALVNPTKFMLRNIQIKDLDIHAVIGGEEPDQTAIQFGRWNAAVYSGLATLRNFVKIKCRKIMLAVDFTQKETTLTAGGIVQIRIYVLLFAALRMIWNLLAHTLNRGKATAV